MYKMHYTGDSLRFTVYSGHIPQRVTQRVAAFCVRVDVVENMHDCVVLCVAHGFQKYIYQVDVRVIDDGPLSFRDHMQSNNIS